MPDLRTTARTHTCGALREKHAGEPVKIAGFVESASEAMLTVRDGYGTTLVILGPSASPAVRRTAGRLKREDVVHVTGEATLRVTPDAANPTGAVYVRPDRIEVLGRAEPLPPEAGAAEPPPELRYLAMRRPAGQRAVQARARLLLAARRRLTADGFAEVEPPVLAPYTDLDPGAFAVPAGRGRCFGLARSSEALRTLAIAADYERAFQVCRRFECAARYPGDRQPESTVLDLALAYADEEATIEAAEGLLAHLIEQVTDRTFERPFPRLTHEEAVQRFGSPRPDLRYDLELKPLTAAVRNAKSFRFIVKEKGLGRGLRVAGGADRIPDAELEGLHDRLKKVGVHKLAWLKLGPEGKARGSGAEEFGEKLNRPLGGEPGDLLIVIGAPNQVAADDVSEALRRHLAERLDLAPKDRLSAAWVTELPLFGFDPKQKAWAPRLHPFTRPHDGHEAKLADAEARATLLGRAFHLVVDGVEVGTGAVGIHELTLQRRVLKGLGIDAPTAEALYGPSIAALAGGVPPHAGLAIDLERLAVALVGGADARAAMPLPKAPDGTDPLLGAPSPLPRRAATAILSR